MAYKTARLLFLAFQVLWLNVVLPGHTRGVIPLVKNDSALASDAASANRGCCSASASQPDCGQTPDSKLPVSGNCAICFFAAYLTFAAQIDCMLADLGPCNPTSLPDPQPPQWIRSILPYNSRGPPVA